MKKLKILFFLGTILLFPACVKESFLSKETATVIANGTHAFSRFISKIYNLPRRLHHKKPTETTNNASSTPSEETVKE